MKLGGRMLAKYPGITLVGGIAMTVLSRGSTYVVPIKSGLGARLGVNVGYLKLTEAPTWNPF